MYQMQIRIVKNTRLAFLLTIVTITLTFAIAQTPVTAQSPVPLPGTALGKLPDGIPPRLFQKMLSGVKLVGSPGLAWNKQRVVTVAFQGGSDDLYTLIEQTANKWTLLGGQLQLSFQDKPGHYRQWTAGDESPVANIRIAFNDGAEGGYWSLLGVLARNVEPNEPTMNFEGFP